MLAVPYIAYCRKRSQGFQVPRIKVKGKAKLSDGWSDVPDGGDSAFRFFTVEVELQ